MCLSVFRLEQKATYVSQNVLITLCTEILEIMCRNSSDLVFSTTLGYSSEKN